MGAHRVGTPLTGSLRFLRVTVVTVTVVVLAAAAHLLGGAPVPSSALFAGMAIVLPSVHVMSRRRLSGRTLFLLLLAGQVVLHHVFCSVGVHHGVEPSILAPEMAVPHLAVTGLTAVLLARGEHVLWALWSWLRRTVAVRVPRVSPCSPVISVRPRPRRGSFRELLLLSTTVLRRGPPGFISTHAGRVRMTRTA
ncbi:hypothetical protein [Saccharomonospora sp.]|uniref:hypothetical protein n=1 Tax=Saccharomonospora sp. TaxID=33913 RepID=UPI002634AA70|nr:hypothetical protein [Saccharomonospora sp.]